MWPSRQVTAKNDPPVRYRFTIENAYLATELIAFCSIYKRQKTSVIWIGKGASKQSSADYVDPEMTGRSFHPTANLHPECDTSGVTPPREHPACIPPKVVQFACRFWVLQG
jgi:hypothetical protein